MKKYVLLLIVAILFGCKQEENPEIDKLRVLIKERKLSIYPKDYSSRPKSKELLDSINKEIREVVIEFINEHPNSIVSLEQLDSNKYQLGNDLAITLYNSLGAKVKHSKEGKNFKEFIERSANLQIGGKYIDISVPNTTGKKVSISKVRKKYTLIDFWSSGCRPCRWEHKNMVKSYEEYNSKGFEIISISTDTWKNDWIKAIKKDGMNWINLSDLKNNQESQAALTYNINSLPTNFLISPSGTIIAKNIRGNSLDKVLKILIDDREEFLPYYVTKENYYTKHFDTIINLTKENIKQFRL